jgi:hypothetical protein
MKVLASGTAKAQNGGPRLELVKSASGSLHRLSPASDTVLKSILHNVQVYEFAASSGELTFNLEVHSFPDHATISYRQHGDKEYTFISHLTDWRIENLPIGVYLIRVQKAGYEDNEEPFDAGTTSVPSITITLEKKIHGK